MSNKKMKSFFLRCDSKGLIFQGKSVYCNVKQGDIQGPIINLHPADADILKAHGVTVVESEKNPFEVKKEVQESLPKSTQEEKESPLEEKKKPDRKKKTVKKEE